MQLKSINKSIINYLRGIKKKKKWNTIRKSVA